MSTIQIVLIRPGQTDFDDQRRITGQLDIPLNELGSGQVIRTVEEVAKLPIGQIYSSPSQPAVQTAVAVGVAMEVKVKQLDRLQNVDLGLWQGKLTEEVKAHQPKVYRRRQEDPDSVCPPEGEMLADVRRRVREALEKIMARNKGDMIAVVVPEPLASVLRSELAGGELGDLWEAENVCGQWEIIDVTEENMLVGSQSS